MQRRINIIGCLVILNFSILTTMISLVTYTYITNQKDIGIVFDTVSQLNNFIDDIELIKNNIDSITTKFDDITLKVDDISDSVYTIENQVANLG